MAAHCRADMAPVPESVRKSSSTSSARSRNGLSLASSMSAARSSRRVRRMGSTDLMRKGSMMVWGMPKVCAPGAAGRNVPRGTRPRRPRRRRPPAAAPRRARLCDASLSMESLSRLNARIFVYVLERVPASASGWTWTVEPPGGGPKQLVAAAPLSVDPGASVVLTLGGLGKRILVTLSDAEPARIAALLARIEREAPDDESDLVLRLDDPFVLENGRAGAALLAPSATRFLPKLPDAVRFDEEAFVVSAVVFLAPDELALAEKHGVDALAERFRIAGRNLVRFAHRARS